MREHVHVVINTHNRLPLIRQTIPRIVTATKSDDRLRVTRSIYDDESDEATREYLASLLKAREIDNLILGSGDLAEYKSLAQHENAYIANYLQVLRACLFVAPATWVLHFTDDALIRFTGLDSRWLLGWIRAMIAEPRIVSIQMTDYEENVLAALDASLFGLPHSAKLFRTNFVSDRYTLYRVTDLLDAFEAQTSRGQYPLAFEETLSNHYSVATPDGRWAVVCQWDDEYVGTHVGAINAALAFNEAVVSSLVDRLERFGSSLSMSERAEFY
jgi:hypothetical protein